MLKETYQHYDIKDSSTTDIKQINVIIQGSRLSYNKTEETLKQSLWVRNR